MLAAHINCALIKIIDVFIRKLRKKIEKISPEGGHCIETVWGRGYVLRENASTAAAIPPSGKEPLHA